MTNLTLLGFPPESWIGSLQSGVGPRAACEQHRGAIPITEGVAQVR